MEKFSKPINFDFTVPYEYEKGKEFGFFQNTIKTMNVSYYSDSFDINKFCNATYDMQPGVTYKISLISISRSKNQIKTYDCMNLFQKEKTLFVGIHGLLLIWRNNLEFFPMNRQVISFDHQNMLWKDSLGYPRAPSIRRSQNGYSFSTVGCFSKFNNYDETQMLLSVIKK